MSRGFALVTVLWAVVLLAVIAAALIRIGHAGQWAARNVLWEAQARALSQAGLVRAIAAMLARDAADDWPLDGTLRRVTIGGRPVEVSIQDELGRIDINAASDDTLKTLLESAGVRSNKAEALVGAMGDWRDADDLKRLHGAEKNEYRAADSHAPRNGPFESVDELAQVAGFTDEILQRVRPALTVLSRLPVLDPAVAPREALLAMPGMDRSKVEEMLQRRRGASDPKPGSGPGRTIGQLIELPGRAFTITSRVELAGRATATRTVAVRFTGDPQRPFLAYDWR